MEFDAIINSLSEDELKRYNSQTASEYFRDLYYSENFIKIIKKIDKDEKLSEDDWQYLTDRLFLVTYKAIQEEDSIKLADRISYILNSICIKVFKNGKMHNECEKMIKFIDSINHEKEINEYLLSGLETVNDSRSQTELNILLKQHREAGIFRDNQDAFIDSYKESSLGRMSNQDIVNMNCMDRAYFRLKELVKKY